MSKEESNVIDFTNILNVKEFVESASERIGELECALYDILDTERLDIAKEIAADVLEEDLEAYLEEDKYAELDFDDSDIYIEPEEGEDLPWEN